MRPTEQEQVRGSVESSPARWARLLLFGPVALYVALGSLLASTGVGLHYDEAIFETGAIDLIGRPSFPQNIPAGMWISVFGRRARLMVLPYAGVPKDYASAIPYAIFGTQPIVGRLVSIALTAIAIAGFGRLVAHVISPAAGVIVALALAVNPAVIDMTVFDNGGVVQAIWALGLIAFAVDRYLRRPTVGRFFWVGATFGFAVWDRLNLLWVLAPLVMVCLVMLWKAWRPRFVEFTTFAAGALIGAAPLIVYEILSGFGSLRSGQAHQDILSHLPTRMVEMGESLIADREHRAIWGAGAPKLWMWVPLVAVAIAACATPFIVRSGPRAWRSFARIMVLTLIASAGLTLTSSFVISEHHTVVLVPLFIISAVIGTAVLIGHRPRARWAAAAILAVYLLAALSFDAAAIVGTRRTQGIGLWSGTMTCMARYLRETDSRGSVGILDWGFTTSLYVLNRGRTPLEDLFWGNAYQDRGWPQEVSSQHRLLLHSETYIQFPAPIEAARTVLSSVTHQLLAVEFRDAAGRVVSRVIELRDSNGRLVIGVPSDVRAAVDELHNTRCPGTRLAQISGV